MPFEDFLQLYEFIVSQLMSKNCRTLFDAISEDFIRREENSSTLKILNSLDRMGKCIDCYDLPTLPPDDLDGVDHYSREVRDEIVVDIPLDDLLAEFNLNTKQYYALSIILNWVQNETSVVFFIDNPRRKFKKHIYTAYCLPIFNQRIR